MMMNTEILTQLPRGKSCSHFSSRYMKCCSRNSFPINSYSFTRIPYDLMQSHLIFIFHTSDYLLYPEELLHFLYTKGYPKIVHLEGRLAGLVCDSQSGRNAPLDSEIKMHK